MRRGITDRQGHECSSSDEIIKRHQHETPSSEEVRSSSDETSRTKAKAEQSKSSIHHARRGAAASGVARSKSDVQGCDGAGRQAGGPRGCAARGGAGEGNWKQPLKFCPGGAAAGFSSATSRLVGLCGSCRWVTRDTVLGATPGAPASCQRVSVQTPKHPPAGSRRSQWGTTL